MQGNLLFHVDSSCDPCRAGLSVLLVHELPYNGSAGGGLAFTDTRTAHDDLDESTNQYLIDKDFINSPISI
jgi:alpha-ketoglutarate-dependent 2,4-dichlorophenoxyacetate dioxygenase